MWVREIVCARESKSEIKMIAHHVTVIIRKARAFCSSRGLLEGHKNGHDRLRPNKSARRKLSAEFFLLGSNC